MVDPDQGKLANKEAVLGWRYTAAQLAKLGATREPAQKRRK